MSRGGRDGRSQETGRFYLTARQATVTSTFNDQTYKELNQGEASRISILNRCRAIQIHNLPEVGLMPEMQESA
jgi:hypothetical protein